MVFTKTDDLHALSIAYEFIILIINLLYNILFCIDETDKFTILCNSIVALSELNKTDEAFSPDR